MQIRDHSFLITGGGSGLGAATARLLTEHGGRVLLADVNEEAVTAHAAALGERAAAVYADVTDEASVQAAVEMATARFGGLHGAVNCAGIVMGRKTLGRQGPHDLESFARVIQVNLVGTFNVLRLAAAAMAENDPNHEGERGVLVNTASVAAFDGQVGQAAYAASKGGIRVMTIAPGIFETPMMAGMTDEVRASLEAQVPFPSRLGRPAEYALLVRQIIENPMLNGETIRLDGAIRMAPR